MARGLVIDDEPVVRELVADVLTAAGHQVEGAEDGGSGVLRYRESPFDLVITDILMPVKDGLEVIRELKADFPDARIIATAAMGDLVLEEAERAGADRTMPKPFRIDCLVEAVSAVLDREA